MKQAACWSSALLLTALLLVAHTASAQFNLDGLRDAVQDALDKAKDAADKAKDAVPDLPDLPDLGGLGDKAKQAADKVDLPDLEELADKVKDKVPAAGGTGLFSCPPKGFDSVRDFNLKAYAAAPWYIQAQLPLSYQPRDELFCVRASYTLRDPRDPSDGVYVRNTAAKGGVKGPGVGNTGSNPLSKLVAVPDPDARGSTAASKLRVGPELLTKLPTPVWKPLLGPYWVVATGASQNKTLAYDWVIVSGGTPRISSLLGCRPGLRPAANTENTYFGGLWFFTRSPNPGPATLAVITAKAVSLGLDITGMVPVPQRGCTYPPL